MSYMVEHYLIVGDIANVDLFVRLLTKRDIIADVNDVYKINAIIQ